MPQPSIFKPTANWRDLYFYRKADVLYQLTVLFCQRFLPAHGDRTVDQMVQAARSGKQNIVEGSEDGKTSTEMEIKLLNVARASIGELREDYEDYLKVHNQQQWTREHPRFEAMLSFCRKSNDYESYASFAPTMGDEEFCNVCITLCHIVDKMMTNYLQQLESRFVTEGGIKERMHAARTGYRREQDEHLRQLESENERLKTILREHNIPFE